MLYDISGLLNITLLAKGLQNIPNTGCAWGEIHEDSIKRDLIDLKVKCQRLEDEIFEKSKTIAVMKEIKENDGVTGGKCNHISLREHPTIHHFR